MAGAGAYGKLPSSGDFVRLGLPRDFVTAWDRWMQDFLAAAKHAHGDRWSRTYLTAPMWRFTARAGILGADSWLGVLVASVDRVGRQFPLTLATALPDGALFGAAHFANDPTFEALEDAALASVQKDLTPDALSNQLSGIVQPRKTTAAMQSDHAWSADDRVALRADLAAANSKFDTSGSVWSADDGARVRMLACSALPRARLAPGFFDLTHPGWVTASSSAA